MFHKPLSCVFIALLLSLFVSGTALSQVNSRKLPGDNEPEDKRQAAYLCQVLLGRNAEYKNHKCVDENGWIDTLDMLVEVDKLLNAKNNFKRTDIDLKRHYHTLWGEDGEACRESVTKSDHPKLRDGSPCYAF